MAPNPSAKASLYMIPSAAGDSFASDHHDRRTRITPSLCPAAWEDSPEPLRSTSISCSGFSNSCGSPYLAPSPAMPFGRDSPLRRNNSNSSSIGASFVNSFKSRTDSSSSVDTYGTSVTSFSTPSSPSSPSKLKKRFNQSVSNAPPMLPSAFPEPLDRYFALDGNVASYQSGVGDPCGSPPSFPSPSAMHEDDGRPLKDFTFEDLNRTVLRRRMPHHPFKREDAPYMQSYSQVVLDNEYHTHELLRRINPHNSPSFHDYGKKPPAYVMDLGCGQGHWALYAAKAWKGSKVVGFDLIDVHSLHDGGVCADSESDAGPKNVIWHRGNFVKYTLPFPDDIFDLVRMADLSLVVPKDRWGLVLTEVRRVLKPAGRLEYISDVPTSPPIRSAPSLSYMNRSNSQERRRPSLDDDDDYHLSDPPSRPKFVKSTSFQHRLNETPLRPRHLRSASQVDYAANAAASQHLETIFDNMLAHKYHISPRPHLFMDDLLGKVFGEENKTLLHEFHLALPHRELFEDASGAKKTNGRRPRYSDYDGENDPCMGTTSNVVAPPISPKAMRMLLGDPEQKKLRPNMPFEPPGLILMPGSTFLPFPPAELEMHLCKGMHTLLGCSDALLTYMSEQTNEAGVRLLSEQECNDYLSDYDRFKRKRFNLPYDYAGLRMEEDLPETSPFASLRRFATSATTVQPLGRERALSSPTGRVPRMSQDGNNMTEVRTIRVYSAVKAASGSLLPMVP